MTDYGIQLFLYSSGYVAISSSRITASGIQYTRGVADDLDLEKGELSARILDADDTYRPTNPQSSWYDILGAYLPMLHRIDGVNRFAGEIERLAPGQTADHQEAAGVTTRGSRWVDFKATGPLGTVGRWRDVVASPLYTQITQYANLRGYWPGEDGSDAQVMSAAYPGVDGAVVSGVTFANSDGPPGSNKLMTINSGGVVNGNFAPDISTTAWQVQWATNLIGADGTERQSFAWRTSNGYWWVLQASNASYRILVIDSTNTTIHSANSLNGGVGVGDDIIFRVKCSLSGGTWTVEPGWYSAGTGEPFFGFSTTFSGTAGRPVRWKTGANTVMVGAYIGHVFAVTTVADDLQDYGMFQAINGYPGETTADRADRILSGRGIPFEVLGDAGDATEMGAQRSGTVKQQLQEIQRTEQGLIFESPDGRGLRLALRRYLYEQATDPALTLTWPDHIAPGFGELSTTQELYNTVIAQDRSGISVVSVEPNGRYGTAGAGLVDKTVDVNMFDADNVRHLSNSYLRYYQQVARFTDITVDLDANPSLRTAVEAADVGMFIRLEGKTPSPQILMIIRVSGNSSRKRHLVTFSTVPGDLFNIGTWSGGRRYGVASATLTSGVNATATALSFTITLDESWSTTAEPYDLTIAGEDVTVTNMNARTGTGPYTQTCTVTRSVNGVVKSQLAGAPVKITHKGRWGW